MTSWNVGAWNEGLGERCWSGFSKVVTAWPSDTGHSGAELSLHGKRNVEVFCVPQHHLSHNTCLITTTAIRCTPWGPQGNLYGVCGVCNLRAKTGEIGAVMPRSLAELRSNMSGLCAPWTKKKTRASRWYSVQSGGLRSGPRQPCRSKGWSELASWLWVLWTDRAWTGVFRKT